MSKKITSLAEIRAQAEPEIVELPGFRPGTTIYVALRMLDLTPRLLQLGVANPLLVEAQGLVREGLDREELAKKLDVSSIVSVLPMLEEIAQAALVEPTYAEITAIHPLTLAQKLKIFEHVMGDEYLPPFRA